MCFNNDCTYIRTQLRHWVDRCYRQWVNRQRELNRLWVTRWYFIACCYDVYLITSCCGWCTRNLIVFVVKAQACWQYACLHGCIGYCDFNIFNSSICTNGLFQVCCVQLYQWIYCHRHFPTRRTFICILHCQRIWSCSGWICCYFRNISCTQACSWRPCENGSIGSSSQHSRLTVTDSHIGRHGKREVISRNDNFHRFRLCFITCTFYGYSDVYFLFFRFLYVFFTSGWRLANKGRCTTAWVRSNCLGGRLQVW